MRDRKEGTGERRAHYYLLSLQIIIRCYCVRMVSLLCPSW